MQHPDSKAQTDRFLSECGMGDERTRSKCRALWELLSAENLKFNLTSIRSEDEYWVKHVCDSASIFLHHRDIFLPGAEVCDIGAGAGFPALIIAMGCKCMVHAVESSRKKASFICRVASALDISNLTVLDTRAEELNRRDEYREKFDIITSRAVGSAGLIFSRSSRMLADDGIYILYKTPAAAESEIKDAKIKNKNIFCSLGRPFELPLGMGERIFIKGFKGRIRR